MTSRLLTHSLLALMLMIGSSFATAKSIEERPRFQHGEHSISGYYKTPSSLDEVKGVVLFIAGDGEVPYDAYGYYDVIWQVILDSGYAVFSWDKPGIGDSAGNWLNQSMQDRQNEVNAAISYVKSTYGYTEKSIGLMGFSQAGWVAPAVMTENPNIGFMIGVGYAMNWMDQGWYMTKNRLVEQAASREDIENAREKHYQELNFWADDPSYDSYLKKYAVDPQSMPEDRFHFIKKNVHADATEDYIGIKQPILILMGDKDANVSTANTYQALSTLFHDSSNATLEIVPNATHGLLKYPEFDEKNPGLGFLIKLFFYGEDAYAPEFLDTLSTWLAAREGTL
ncbi:alpha/beta hydrolase [uncultured Vibrio sp.]|uniref:alpha/beta hydrolase family protein n=1 Tax=uncultured Vibrio sp. TaxID=114054 RepID=UPI0025F8AB4E|nr:alpha/beta hydrolase [uncultured Vibrio sp.]